MNSWYPFYSLAWRDAGLLSPAADVWFRRAGYPRIGAGFAVVVLILASALLLGCVRGIAGRDGDSAPLRRFWSVYARNCKAAARARLRRLYLPDVRSGPSGRPGMESGALACRPARTGNQPIGGGLPRDRRQHRGQGRQAPNAGTEHQNRASQYVGRGRRRSRPAGWIGDGQVAADDAEHACAVLAKDALRRRRQRGSQEVAERSSR